MSRLLCFCASLGFCLAPAVHGASAMGYPACMVACIAAICVVNPGAHVVPGASEAACVAACAAGCLCLGEDVHLVGRNGSFPASKARVGDEVLTLEADTHLWTVVSNTVKVEQSGLPFAFVKVESLGRPPLSVTKTQPVFVKRGDSMWIVEAGSLKVGDDLFAKGGEFARIVAITPLSASAKYVVDTLVGTVLANDVLVPTAQLGNKSLASRRWRSGNLSFSINPTEEIEALPESSIILA